MDKSILRQCTKVNGFHEPDTWSRSFKLMYNKKEQKKEPAEFGPATKPLHRRAFVA